MMPYTALTFWLLVLVLTAAGVHRLLSAVVRPKVLNAALLPGTLVAQLGHVLGLLITGATVRNNSLLGNDSWDPETTTDPKPRIPVVGPIIIGMLPLMACGTAVLLVVQYVGGSVLARVRIEAVTAVLPTTLGGGWQLLRDLISLAESFVSAMLRADWTSWDTWLFAYLLTCLTIRMAPFPGTMRGSLGATVVLGIAATAVGSLFATIHAQVPTAWSLLNLTVAAAIVLLLLSLLVRAVTSLARLFTRGG